MCVFELFTIETDDDNFPTSFEYTITDVLSQFKIPNFFTDPKRCGISGQDLYTVPMEAEAAYTIDTASAFTEPFKTLNFYYDSDLTIVGEYTMQVDVRGGLSVTRSASITLKILNPCEDVNFIWLTATDLADKS